MSLLPTSIADSISSLSLWSSHFYYEGMIIKILLIHLLHSLNSLLLLFILLQLYIYILKYDKTELPLPWEFLYLPELLKILFYVMRILFWRVTCHIQPPFRTRTPTLSIRGGTRPTSRWRWWCWHIKLNQIKLMIYYSKTLLIKLNKFYFILFIKWEIRVEEVQNKSNKTC